MKGARLLSRAETDLVEMATVPNRYGGYSHSGVHVTPDFTEATNGHLLVRLPKPDMDPADFPVVEGTEPDAPDDVILPVESLKGWKPAKGNSIPILNYLRLTSHHGTVDLASTDLETCKVNRVKPIEGTFPKTDKVIPAGLEPAFAFDPVYLKLLASWAQKHGAKSMIFHPPKDPVTDGMLITTRLQDGREATMVLMPVRF